MRATSLGFRVASRAAIGAVACLIASHAVGAAETNGSPFGDAELVSDSSLDEMRGGFDTGRGTVPFGVDIHYDTYFDGHQIADFDINNHGGGRHWDMSSHNLNTVVNVTNLTQPSGPAQNPDPPGQTTIESQVTPTALMTFVQNSESNVQVQTQQAINVILSGNGMAALLKNVSSTAQAAALARFLHH